MGLWVVVSVGGCFQSSIPENWAMVSPCRLGHQNFLAMWVKPGQKLCPKSQGSRPRQALYRCNPFSSKTKK